MASEDKSVQRLAEVLTSPGKTLGETERVLAEEIATAVREKRGPPPGCNQQFRSIVANLKQNEELREDVLARRLDATFLATATSADLKTKDRQREDRAREAMQMSRLENAGREADGAVHSVVRFDDTWTARSPSFCAPYTSTPPPAWNTHSPHFNTTGGGHDFDDQWQTVQESAEVPVQESGEAEPTGLMALTRTVGVLG